MVRRSGRAEFLHPGGAGREKFHGSKVAKALRVLKITYGVKKTGAMEKRGKKNVKREGANSDMHKKGGNVKPPLHSVGGGAGLGGGGCGVLGLGDGFRDDWGTHET